jgi:hypothetical protein
MDYGGGQPRPDGGLARLVIYSSHGARRRVRQANLFVEGVIRQDGSAFRPVPSAGAAGKRVDAPSATGLGLPSYLVESSVSDSNSQTEKSAIVVRKTTDRDGLAG